MTAIAKRLGITPLTPRQCAEFTMRLTGGNPNPDITAKTYRANAETMRQYAAKAAAHKSGKYRGYTQADALELAAMGDERAISVPAEIRKLMAERAP